MNLRTTFITESREIHPPRWAFLSILGSIEAMDRGVTSGAKTALEVMDHIDLDMPATERELLRILRSLH
jgi:hypothetical protein